METYNLRFKSLIYLLVFCSCFSFVSCLRPYRSFERSKVTSAPDYSQELYWAALPTKKDSADAVPYGSGLKDEQSTAKVDVFFIYPTIYWSGKTWNADVNNERLNKKIDRTTILSQATVFNGSCKIYAPRYRQAVLKSFFVLGGKGKKALDFAYKDVKVAFDYYMKHYNNGRPVIIASHSQGTWHAERLLHDYFDNDSALRKKLVAAYIIGGAVKKYAFVNIPGCNSRTQTGCVICWNSRKWGMSAGHNYGIDLECVNPLTWKSDTVAAPVSLNMGSIPFGFKGIEKGIADAKVAPSGLLWVHKKNEKGFQCVSNYHILDYSLFWMNIRENIKQRVDAYLSNNK